MRCRQVSASVQRPQATKFLRSINRNRRIKCDESKPRCSKCFKAGRDCVYSVQPASVDDSLFKPTSVHYTPAEHTFIEKMPVERRNGLLFSPAPLRDINEAIKKLKSLLEASAAAISRTKILNTKTDCFELYGKSVARLRDDPHMGCEASEVIQALEEFDRLLEKAESSLLLCI